MAKAYDTGIGFDSTGKKVVLELSVEEAEAVTALLYSGVGGTGRMRDLLTSNDDSVCQALTDLIGVRVMRGRHDEHRFVYLNENALAVTPEQNLLFNLFHGED